MKSQLRYTFNYINHCNMCGSATGSHLNLGKRLNQSQGRNPRNKIGITTTICKCTVCNLIYSNPQPVPFDIQDHYGVPPEDYWKPEYFIATDGYFADQISRFKSLVDFKVGMKALDIGAGLGKGIIAMTRAGFDTYGFEPSKHFYKWAIDQMGMDPGKFKCGMMENMDYPDNHFDFISFGAVLEHLYDPAMAIGRAMKWLKPGGLIQIEVPSSKWLVNKLVNFYYKMIGTDYVANISPMHEPFHLHEFDLKSFELNAKTSQYEIAFHEYYVCQTYLPKVLDYFIVPYMKWTNTGMQLCVWLRKRE